MWADLEQDIAELFEDIRLGSRVGFTVRKLKCGTPGRKRNPNTPTATERMRRWRAANRERRNATARACYARKKARYEHAS